MTSVAVVHSILAAALIMRPVADVTSSTGHKSVAPTLLL